MNRDEAWTILTSMTQSEALLRHAESVELVMKAYAQKYGEDPLLWGNTGLLHDADYEAYPDQHPNIIVTKLREMGEEAMAYAISAHYTHWGNPVKSLLDKALLASDELTGFIGACCHVRPGGIETLEPKSVKKKFKQKSFAAKVDRDEVMSGVAALEVDFTEHIHFIINALKPHKEKLVLQGHG